MAKPTDPAKPNAEQQALIKGKTPRNAILSIGLLAALVIGGLGFYYELKASDQAQEDARLKKAAALKSSAEVPGTKNSDIDQLIRQQQEAAASEAAARAASDAAGAARASVKPVLTSNDFKSEVSNPGGDTRELSEKNNKDTIYTSSIFKQSGASRNANQQTGSLPPGVPSLDDFKAARAAVTTNPTDAMALALAKQGQAPEDRDRAFLKDAAGEGGIVQTTFNGRSRGCTLTPPHNIHVKTVEGLNSDKPGRVALMVDEDIYRQSAGRLPDDSERLVHKRDVQRRHQSRPGAPARRIDQPASSEWQKRSDERHARRGSERLFRVFGRREQPFPRDLRRGIHHSGLAQDIR